jgi:ABC-type nickel/cobalt efflux system permease component RcnA
MKRKIRKSTWLSLALFAYMTIMALYFLPKNTELDTTRKWLTLGAGYLIVLVLWLVMRKKENMRRKHWDDNL